MTLHLDQRPLHNVAPHNPAPRLTVALVCGCLLLSVPAFAAPMTRRPTHAAVKHRLRKTSHSSLRHAEAPSMAAERATEIQAALIRKGYLAGEPSGNWDPQTVAAMQKLQSDNGWQSKVTPDARALIKLGLGPAPMAPAGATAPVSPR